MARIRYGRKQVSGAVAAWSLLLAALIASAFLLCGCGKVSAEDKPGTQASTALSLSSDTASAEEPAESTAAPEPDEQTAATAAEDTQPDNGGQSDLDALFGPEQVDYTVDMPAEYIGSQQIETEYTIMDPEDGVTLTQEQIDRMDLLCKTMEDVTGLSFLKSKYGTDKKVTVHIYQVIGSGSTDDVYKSISIDTACLEKPNFIATIHELVHILQICNMYSGGFPFYTEGHAEFWTCKIAQYILDNKVEGLYEMIDLENEFSIWKEYTAGDGDVTAIYDHDLDYWIDRGCYFNFSDSWPAYVYGRLFFLYLDDVYGDPNAFLPIYARIPYAITGMDENEGAGGRKYMDTTPLKKMMTVAYGEDVFDNFYPWLKEHEDLLEQYS